MPGGFMKRRDKPIRVVLADDQAEVRRALTRHLTRDGRFEIVGEAQDGEEAVKLVVSQLPDVVIMDLAMPNMNGLQAIKEITEHSSATKIVVLSATVPFSDTRDDALSLGAHAVLDKNTHPKKLIKALVGALDRGR